MRELPQAAVKRRLVPEDLRELDGAVSASAGRCGRSVSRLKESLARVQTSRVRWESRGVPCDESRSDVSSL